MESTPHQQPTSQRDFFDVYQVAIRDLHASKDLSQRIDSFYLTILTLLLTADAYEIATTKFDVWEPTFLTLGVTLIGIVVTIRWRQGANNLYDIVKNRYAWLRRAEERPEMKFLGADVFTDEYKVIYEEKRGGGKKKNAAQPPQRQEHGVSMFRRRTTRLQTLCILIFALIPIIVGGMTSFNLNPWLLQTIQRAFP